uniref:Uncharacterized protein n=1 Tax=Aegilops tauschii TaxID=37682 RepID=N1QX36_AEGTA
MGRPGSGSDKVEELGRDNDDDDGILQRGSSMMAARCSGMTTGACRCQRGARGRRRELAYVSGELRDGWGKREIESGGVQEVASSMALRSGMTLCDDIPLEEKGRGMGSGGAQAVSSSMTLCRRSRDDPNEERRSGVERGTTQAVVLSTAPRSMVALGADGRPLDGIMHAELLWKLKHGEGSIYRINGYWAKVYGLYDTSESI